MQEHYDNFFEDVFVECEDKYGQVYGYRVNNEQVLVFVFLLSCCNRHQEIYRKQNPLDFFLKE